MLFQDSQSYLANFYKQACFEPAVDGSSTDSVDVHMCWKNIPQEKPLQGMMFLFQMATPDIILDNHVRIQLVRFWASSLCKVFIKAESPWAF